MAGKCRRHGGTIRAGGAASDQGMPPAHECRGYLGHLGSHDGRHLPPAHDGYAASHAKAPRSWASDQPAGTTSLISADAPVRLPGRGQACQPCRRSTHQAATAWAREGTGEPHPRRCRFIALAGQPLCQYPPPAPPFLNDPAPLLNTATNNCHGFTLLLILKKIIEKMEVLAI